MVKKQKTVISINPPPRDKKCECCNRHISKLKLFGGAGDPLVGDFKGQLLLKNFRSMAQKQTKWKIKSMMVHGRKLTKAEQKEYKVLGDKQKVPELNYKKEVMKGCWTVDIKLLSKTEEKRFRMLEKKHYASHPHLDEKKFIDKYSKKDLEQFYFHDQLENTVEASWECRDCIVLYGKEFYEKRGY